MKKITYEEFLDRLCKENPEFEKALEEERNKTIDHIKTLKEEIAKLRGALHPFAYCGTVLEQAEDEGVQITTMVYEQNPKNDPRRPFTQGEMGEVDLPQAPIKPTDWLFGIWITRRDTPAAIATPVISASWFYDAQKAYYKNINRGNK